MLWKRPLIDINILTPSARACIAGCRSHPALVTLSQIQRGWEMTENSLN